MLHSLKVNNTSSIYDFCALVKIIKQIKTKFPFKICLVHNMLVKVILMFFKGHANWIRPIKGRGVVKNKAVKIQMEISKTSLGHISISGHWTKWVIVSSSELLDLFYKAKN